MQKVAVEIVGISPLLMHRFAEGKAEEKTKIKNIKNNEDDIEASLYKFDDGSLYQPALHLISSLKKAGAKYKIPGRSKETFKNVIGSGAVIITPDAIPHNTKSYEVDSRAVVIAATKGRVIRKRPMLNKWKLAFDIDVDTDEISLESIKEMLDYAGRRVGIGDFRPEKGGSFGRFMVSKFK